MRQEGEERGSGFEVRQLSEKEGTREMGMRKECTHVKAKQGGAQEN